MDSDSSQGFQERRPHLPGEAVQGSGRRGRRGVSRSACCAAASAQRAAHVLYTPASPSLLAPRSSPPQRQSVGYRAQDVQQLRRCHKSVSQRRVPRQRPRRRAAAAAVNSRQLVLLLRRRHLVGAAPLLAEGDESAIHLLRPALQHRGGMGHG